MRPRKSSTAPPLVLFVLSILLAGLLAGCGGGGEQKGAGGGGGEAQKQGGEAARRDPPERKIAIGTIKGVNEDKRHISLRPAAEAQGKKPLRFKVRKNAEIAMAGKKIAPGDVGSVTEGQQAQIEYVVKNNLNRAVAVQLYEVQEQQPSGAGEKTG